MKFGDPTIILFQYSTFELIKMREKLAEKLEELRAKAERKRAELEAETKAKGLHELRAESWWGAVASFLLLQIFSFILFQAFLFYFSGSIFVIVWGGVMLFILIIIQSATIGVAAEFLSKYGIREARYSLRRLSERVKFFIAVIFAVILVLFILGYYPFPKKEASLFSEGVFFVFCWALSGGMSSSKKGRAVIYMTKGPAELVALGFGGIFFAIGLFIPDVFYYHGIMGLVVSIMVITSILLKD